MAIKNLRELDSSWTAEVSWTKTQIFPTVDPRADYVYVFKVTGSKVKVTEMFLDRGHTGRLSSSQAVHSRTQTFVSIFEAVSGGNS